MKKEINIKREAVGRDGLTGKQRIYARQCSKKARFEKYKKGALIIFFVFLFILVFFGFGSGVQEKIEKARQTMTWAETTGTLTWVIERRHTGRGDHLEVKYKYIVKGVDYIGTRHSILRDDKKVHSILKGNEDRYFVGVVDLELSVFFNPNNPSESVLIRGYDKEYIKRGEKVKYIILLLLGLMSMASVYLFVKCLSRESLAKT